MHSYILRHQQAMQASIKRLRKTPIASLLTISVIACALVLPASLYVFLQNAKQVTTNWDKGSQLTLYLKKELSGAELDELIIHLRTRDDVGEINYISPDQGLDEFEKQSHFSNLLEALKENPLPAVVEVHPSMTAQKQDAIEALIADLKTYPEVESIELDLQWIKRLQSIISLIQRGIMALSVLLAAAVLLIIGNTIRLTIENHHTEIEIVQLVGADPAYVRRPFLYTGFFYAILGSLMALLILHIALFFMSGSVKNLMAQYNSHFHLQGIGFGPSMILILTSILLGLQGAAWAVKRHLQS